jgi:ADP-ribose diphosphatase
MAQARAYRSFADERVRRARIVAASMGDRLDGDELAATASSKKYLSGGTRTEALQDVEPRQWETRRFARKHQKEIAFPTLPSWSSVGWVPSSPFDGPPRHQRKNWRNLAFAAQIPAVSTHSQKGREDALPAPPAIRLEIVGDRTAEARATGGFLDIQRVDLIARYADGHVSEPFPYDIAVRKALDAVVILAHFVDAGVSHVYLRSAVRPPCALRALAPAHDGLLWELPAGLVEPKEEPVDCAVRELEEELGFSSSPDHMRPLGHWAFPAPGIIGERHVFFTVQVDPRDRKVPSEDGSALEHGAAIMTLPLELALSHCREGAIRDSKTELALRRFAEAS